MNSTYYAEEGRREAALLDGSLVAAYRVFSQIARSHFLKLLQEIMRWLDFSTTHDYLSMRYNAQTEWFNKINDRLNEIT